MTDKTFLVFARPRFKEEASLAEEIRTFLRLGLTTAFRDIQFTQDGVLLVRAESGNAKALCDIFRDHKWRSVVVVENGAENAGVPDRLKGFLAPAQTITPPPALLALPKPAAAAQKINPMVHFLGVEKLIEDFRESCQSEIVKRLRNALCPDIISEDTYLNTLITGPTGVGKTSLARAFADEYKACGLVPPNAPVSFVAAKALVREYTAQGDVALKKKLDGMGAGVLVIDEIDALLSVHSYGISMLETLNEHMGNSRNTPIIIATAYAKNESRLLAVDDGLDRRMPIRIAVEAPSLEILAQIFMRLADLGGYAWDNPHKAQANAALLIRNVRDAKGEQFGNAGEVGNIFNRTLRTHNVRLVNSGGMELLKKGAAASAGEKAFLDTLRAADIPEWNLGFVPRPPERTEDMSARVTQGEGDKVVSLRKTAPTQG